MCAPEEKEIKMKCVSIGYKFGIVLILLFQINASRNRIKELKSEMSLKQIGLVFSDLYRVKLRFSFQFTIASRREIFSKTGLDFKKSSTDPPNANIFRFSRASSSFLFRGCSSTRLLPPKLQIREVYDVCHETSLASCAIKFSGNPSRSEVTPADLRALFRRSASFLALSFGIYALLESYQTGYCIVKVKRSTPVESSRRASTACWNLFSLFTRVYAR